MLELVSNHAINSMLGCIKWSSKLWVIYSAICSLRRSLNARLLWWIIASLNIRLVLQISLTKAFVAATYLSIRGNILHATQKSFKICIHALSETQILILALILIPKIKFQIFLKWGLVLWRCVAWCAARQKFAAAFEWDPYLLCEFS